LDFEIGIAQDFSPRERPSKAELGEPVFRFLKLGGQLNVDEFPEKRK
jgi:hypothetical protein